MHSLWPLIATLSLPLLVSSIPNAPAITARAIAPDEQISLSPSQSSVLNAEFAAPDEQISLSPSQTSLLNAEYASWTATIEGSAALVTNNYYAPLVVNDDGPSSLSIYTKGGNPGCVNCATWLDTAECPASITDICAKLAASASGQGAADAWVWSGLDTVENHHGCVMGYFMPKSVVGQKGNGYRNGQPLEGYALVPNAEQCEKNVFGAMVNSSTASIVASVNLVKWPDASGADGEQADAGLISFMMLPQGYNQAGV